MKCPFCIKICTQCKRLLVANKINFTGHKNMKYGVSSKCKVCENENRRKKYNNDSDYKEKVSIMNQLYYKNNKESISKRQKEHYEQNKDYILERQKEYYEQNKDHILERQFEYYNTHKEEDNARSREYYKNNKEKMKERQKIYNLEHPEVSFNAKCKRRFREEEQGSGLTKEQWKEMMDYFDWQCAYSGKYIGNNSDQRTIDHIIPLSKGGEHEIWNLVPMYYSYNSSKNNKDMLTWYTKQDFYSKDRLDKIHSWIEYAKNKWRDANESKK